MSIRTFWFKHGKEVRSVVIGMFIGAVVIARVLSVIASHQDTSPNPTIESQPITITDFLPAAEPTRLRIPALAIDADFEEALGLTEYQEIEVPDDFWSVGWYQHGPTPGEQGPAVVLGHVDSYEGPAVFHQLWRLQRGDEIIVDRADGSTATFIVSHKEKPEQSQFPTEAVYGDIDHAGLRLVTCIGDFDQGAQRYSHNLVVYGNLQMTE